MNCRTRAAALAVLLALGCATTATATAVTPSRPNPAASSVDRVAMERGAFAAASVRHVEEGSRYTVTATINSARQAGKVSLQKYDPPNYSFQTPAWNTVRTAAVNGRTRVKFPVIAVEPNNERYRVIVTYKHAKPATSKPVSVTVWRWIPLNEYDPYYLSEPFGTDFGTTTINGQAYNGWGAASYSHTGTWEARFTPGRHCTHFHGVLGVGDSSADGSRATIAITADDNVMYESPTLTPGMALPVTVSLTTKPYRFGIRLFDTTPGSTTGRDTIEAWPVIGEPALHCTGV